MEVMRYRIAFERVKKIVMPVVLAKAEKEKQATGKKSTRWSRLANRWWQLRDAQPGTIAAIDAVPRYIACSRVTRRPVFEFVSSEIHPDNTLIVFPFADERPAARAGCRNRSTFRRPHSHFRRAFALPFAAERAASLSSSSSLM